MRHGPALLRGAAAALWAVTLVTAFTGFDNHRAWSALDERVWTCALCGALVATLATTAGKAARLYVGMTKQAISRPPYSGPPSVPLKIVPVQGRQPARHASRL